MQKNKNSNKNNELIDNNKESRLILAPMQGSCDFKIKHIKIKL